MFCVTTSNLSDIQRAVIVWILTLHAAVFIWLDICVVMIQEIVPFPCLFIWSSSSRIRWMDYATMCVITALLAWMENKSLVSQRFFTFFSREKGSQWNEMKTSAGYPQLYFCWPLPTPTFLSLVSTLPLKDLKWNSPYLQNQFYYCQLI